MGSSLSGAVLGAGGAHTIALMESVVAQHQTEPNEDVLILLMLSGYLYILNAAAFESTQDSGFENMTCTWGSWRRKMGHFFPVVFVFWDSRTTEEMFFEGGFFSFFNVGFYFF